jgi:hypothetical protein
MLLPKRGERPRLILERNRENQAPSKKACNSCMADVVITDRRSALHPIRLSRSVIMISAPRGSRRRWSSRPSACHSIHSPPMVCCKESAVPTADFGRLRLTESSYTCNKILSDPVTLSCRRNSTWSRIACTSAWWCRQERLGQCQESGRPLPYSSRRGRMIPVSSIITRYPSRVFGSLRTNSRVLRATITFRQGVLPSLSRATYTPTTPGIAIHASSWSLKTALISRRVNVCSCGGLGWGLE